MNRKRIKNILIVTACLLLVSHEALAERINFNLSVKQAVDNSYDLKTSAFDIKISKTNLKSARSEFFPTLSTQLNTEYARDLANNPSLSSVGNTVLPNSTKFQNLASLNLSYNVFDFGATGKKVLIAKKDVIQKQVMCDIQLKELKLNILELYTKALLYHDEITRKSKILEIYKELFLSKEKLFQSGTSNKISVMEEAVKIARTIDSIESLKTQLKITLKDLSSYTKQKYEINDIVIDEFEDTNIVPISNIKPDIKGSIETGTVFIPQFNPDLSAEAKYYDLEIEKKKAELAMYKRQMLPAFKFYTTYSFYGQNPDSEISSIKDVKQRSLSFGFTTALPVFDGFKNKTSREKVFFEIEKLKVEKEKKINELYTNYEKSYTSYLSYNEELKLKQELLNKINDKLKSLERLISNGLATKSELLEQKAELLTEEIELQKNLINISSKIKETKIITGDDL